ncbi:MAG: serine/threonine protein kinase [Myxococcaceae bacterium]|nr:serine/threonine protein kinase [Myxococcaceae bacterium]
MSLVGRQIGRYRILEQLGQGGMSVVYKGLDTALDREVAVKVLHPHLAGRDESRKRLAREAKAVARLHHPNILEVFDFAGADDQDAYIVTEYIRGKTLRQFLSEESLDPPEVAAMVVHEIASALGHAHDSGVIHRDLKPENVMLRDDGVLKLMDFGIAKILDRDEKMTMTGALVGSPAHMAPEIIEGEEAGPEADVFSLGTMLYMFATGRLPFTAANTTATLKKILDCAYEDPRQVVPTVSDELADIIAMCLVRQPSQRLTNAGKLKDKLATYLADLGLTRVHEELPRFFSNPGQYRKELTPRMTTALLKRSEQLIADKRSAKALASLNHVLALDPGNTLALGLLTQLKASKAKAQRQGRLMRGAFAAGTAFVVAMGVWKGVAVAREVQDFHPPLVRLPTDVVLAASVFPPPPPVKVELPVPVDPPRVVIDPKGLEPIKPVGVKPVDPKKPLLPAAQELVKVTVKVRPFGYLSVDGAARTRDQLTLFELNLPAGRHTFTVSCEEHCEPAGRSTQLEVQPGRSNEIWVNPPLKPSLVTFEGFPDDATVRIGAEQRTVGQARARPFRIETPPEGSAQQRHLVTYEVTQDGQLLQGDTLPIIAGKAQVIDRKAR